MKFLREDGKIPFLSFSNDKRVRTKKVSNGVTNKPWRDTRLFFVINIFFHDGKKIRCTGLFARACANKRVNQMVPSFRNSFLLSK